VVLAINGVLCRSHQQARTLCDEDSRLDLQVQIGPYARELVAALVFRGTTPAQVRFFFFFFISRILQLTPRQQSAEPRNSAGAEALAVARRPKEASREKRPGRRRYREVLLPEDSFFSCGVGF